MLNTLKVETNKKKKQLEMLKNDLDRLRQSFNTKNSLHVSSFDLEAIRNEITELTNRKANIELKIRES